MVNRRFSMIGCEAPARGRLRQGRCRIAGLGLFRANIAMRFDEGRVRCLGVALAQVLHRNGQPEPSVTGMRDFYNLATSALRYLTVAVLPDAARQQAEATEIARIYLAGIRA